VVFRFDGLYPDNLFAATIVRREGEPIDFHFDGQENGPNYNSGGIEGMWWLPAASSTDYLILSNPLKKTVTGTLALTSSLASHRPAALSLGPGETKRINLGEVLGTSSIGAVGGLSLSLPGKELISATQIVFDEVTGLAAMMKMFDREPDDQPKSRVLLAPMMALSQPDQGLGFPNGTQLHPRIFLRNAGPAPTQVPMSVDWRSETKSGELALSPLALSQGEVKVINLADDQKSGQIPPDASWGTLKLAYTGRRADLVAVAVSYDKANRYGLQTPFSEDLSRMWAGGMWHVDPTHNTFITTGNGGAEATTAEVTLFYNGGTSKYRMEKMLSPGQQLWLDVGHLVHDQIPDSDGHTLPPDTMTGSYELRDLDHAYVGQLYEGKLVIDKTYGHAAYGCGSCCGLDAPAFNPTSFTGPVNIDGGETIDAADTCTGGIVDVTGDANDWASSDTAVATLSKATLHTVAVGSATGSTLAKLQWAHPPACPQTTFGPTQPVSVTAVPTRFHLTTAEPANDNVTPSLEADFAWQSSDGNYADLNGCFIRENVTFPNTNNGACPSSSQNCFFASSPPWAAKGSAGSGYANPTITSPGVNAVGLQNSDIDSVNNLNFVKPYSAAPYSGTQYFQYSCGSGAWTNLYGPVSINYSMAKNSAGNWQVVVSRSDTSVTSVYLIPNQ
jgi:hypothetical protein